MLRCASRGSVDIIRNFTNARTSECAGVRLLRATCIAIVLPGTHSLPSPLSHGT